MKHTSTVLTLAAASPIWPGRWETFWWARRALRNELWGFRFHYPIEVVPVATPDALHYHIHSEHLFFDVMELDDGGVPIQRGRVFGAAYNPSYVAWYGLVRLAGALRGGDPDGRAAFLRQIEWLASHAVRRCDGAVVWHYDFDWIEDACTLRAPWISAMAQGLIMSALVRGHRMTGDAHLLELAGAATKVFDQAVDAGGVRTQEDGHVLYEEYPGLPPPRVLDGFLFSLLGLHDVFVETGAPEVRRLFTEGINGLRHALPFWNYRDRWSLYGARRYLCPPHYHMLNRALLVSLARLSGEPLLDRYARMWDPVRLTAADRTALLAVFIWAKNRTRLAHHLTLRSKRAAAQASA